MTDETDAVLVEHPNEEEMARETGATNSTVASTRTTEASGDKEEVMETLEDGTPRAIQFVSIGTEVDAYAFTFHEEKLNFVLSKIPAGWKTSVVSVVGAFRTGKSFLLSWFLRYLNHLQESEKEDGVESTDDKNWFESFDSLGTDGFDWRGGAERNTTGIWMWSEPHFIKKDNGEEVAVLLVDTQGMFDHETTMALTASIFGLSTLLSSYQIYNVDKRIQEDNLQQLALFSEYARMAMRTNKDVGDDDDEGDVSSKSSTKPFQRIEFLVRDWQHFEAEEDFDEMEKEMEQYLESVIAEREAKDLKDTRDQIISCFERVSCYAFVHPGMAVTKKKYNGSVKSIDPDFLKLLDRYCKRVFNLENMEPKIIQGRELTAVELGSYAKAYAKLFEGGAHFPEAATLLDATAQANNTNAVYLSIEDYKEEMDRIAGPSCCNYVKPDELHELHREIMQRSMRKFRAMANFGHARGIAEAKEKLARQVDENFALYSSLNDSRNPLAGLELYFLPMMIGLLSYVMRVVADSTCSGWSSVCRRGSDLFSHTNTVAFWFIVILLSTRWRQLEQPINRAGVALGLVAIDGGKVKKD